MGRRTKLTPEVQAAIVDLVEKGIPLEASAAQAGIHPGTLHNWRARGREEGSGIYFEFDEAIKAAEPRAVASLALMWREHFASSWQAIATYMERRWPQDWSRRTLRPDDPVANQSITVVFNRPEIDPDEKGDDLVVVNDVGEKPGNGGSK